MTLLAQSSSIGRPALEAAPMANLVFVSYACIAVAAVIIILFRDRRDGGR